MIGETVVELDRHQSDPATAGPCQASWQAGHQKLTSISSSPSPSQVWSETSLRAVGPVMSRGRRLGLALREGGVLESSSGTPTAQWRRRRFTESPQREPPIATLRGGGERRRPAFEGRWRRRSPERSACAGYSRPRARASSSKNLVALSRFAGTFRQVTIPDGWADRDPPDVEAPPTEDDPPILPPGEPLEVGAAELERARDAGAEEDEVPFGLPLEEGDRRRPRELEGERRPLPDEPGPGVEEVDALEGAERGDPSDRAGEEIALVPPGRLPDDEDARRRRRRPLVPGGPRTPLSVARRGPQKRASCRGGRRGGAHGRTGSASPRSERAIERPTAS